jgi:hypothetical protein
MNEKKVDATRINCTRCGKELGIIEVSVHQEVCPANDIDAADIEIQRRKHHATVFGTVPQAEDVLIKKAIADKREQNRKEEREQYGERTRANWIGAPEFFNLNQLCVILNYAFDSTSYLVGSSLHKRDYRDVDIRCMMDDEKFDKMFPGMGGNPQHHALWSLMCSSISEWLSKRSGLPVDFQLQRTTDANKEYGGKMRNAIGLFYATESGRIKKKEEENG